MNKCIMIFDEKYDINKLKFLKSFDQDQYAKAIHKENTPQKDIKTSYEYFKKFINNCIENNGNITCNYSQNNFRGRYYARQPSIQQCSKYIRGFLCSDEYTDIDIKNCYPVILRYICKIYEITCPHLTYYVEHRDEILKNNDNEENIKELIFQIIFGSKKKINNNFLLSFKKECDEIHTILSKTEDYKKYYETNPKDYNKGSSVLFKIIEDVEIEIIKELIIVLNNKNIKVLSYMYDGVMIYGNNHNSDLLKEINEKINKKFNGMNINFVFKKHINELQEKFNDFEEPKEESCEENVYDYEDWKKLWEVNVFSIKSKNLICHDKYASNNIIIEANYGSKNYFINDNEFVKLTTATYPVVCKNKVIYKSCVERWNKDSNKREYLDYNFFPPPKKIISDQKFYNTWRDFALENYIITKEINKEHCIQVYKDFKKHLSKNNEKVYDYLIQLDSHTIQYPCEKIGVALIINGPSGTGKGTETILQYGLLGTDYVYDTSDITQVLGQFTGAISRKLVVILDEAVPKNMFFMDGALKHLITEEKIKIERKCKDSYLENSYVRLIITSNNDNVVKITNSDRRMLVISPDIYRPKIYNQYPQNIHTLCHDPDCCKIIYDYLKTVPIKYKNISDWQENRPITEEYKEMQEYNTPTFIKFMLKYVDNSEKNIIKINQNDLYIEFKHFVSENKRYELSADEFFKKCKKIKSITKERIQIDHIRQYNYIINKFNFKEEMELLNYKLSDY